MRYPGVMSVIYGFITRDKATASQKPAIGHHAPLRTNSGAARCDAAPVPHATGVVAATA